MKADLTRDTFNPTNHFSRVLMQQGRVTLDADHNEQTSILLYYLRTLARDLIGPYAAPVDEAGFALSFDTSNGLKISQGRYYVDGIMIENDADSFYANQPDFTPPADDALLQEIKNQTGKVFWIYVDVWERHITAIEDDDIREKALNGPDTCTRAKVVWQVKGLLQPNLNLPLPANLSCATPLQQLVAVSQASLSARVDPGQQMASACITPPQSKYRGTENQLYRVEIHQGGKVGDATQPTFKWSRDNGSVVTAWLGTSGNDLQVSRARGFEAGNWVELSDDTQELQGLPGVLVRLTKADGATLSVDPASLPSQDAIAWSNTLVNPKIRRWDQIETDAITLVQGAVPIKERGIDRPSWIDLEDGIQIEFSPGGQYRTGDYWLIPARVSTGDIQWPFTLDSSGNAIPDFLPPDGIEHHYAPLGYVSLPVKEGSTFPAKSCQCTFQPGSNCWSATAAKTLPAGFDAKLTSEQADEEAKLSARKKRVK